MSTQQILDSKVAKLLLKSGRTVKSNSELLDAIVSKLENSAGLKTSNYVSQTLVRVEHIND